MFRLSFKSSSGPSRNRSKFINVYGSFWDPLGSFTWRAWRWLKRVETCRPKI